MKLSIKKNSRGKRAGFTLLEALLLVTILAIGGAGIGTAMTSMARSPGQNNSSLAVETALVDKMEYLHSLTFATLAADVGASPSSFSDTPTVDGGTVTRNVSIVYVVPSTGAVSLTATHMLQVSVSVDVRSFVSLVNEP